MPFINVSTVVTDHVGLLSSFFLVVLDAHILLAIYLYLFLGGIQGKMHETK